jgi:hypothetical protein
LKASRRQSTKHLSKNSGIDAEFDTVMNDSMRFLYPVRDLDLQIDRANLLAEFIGKLNQAKNAVAGTGNPDAANKLLGMEYFAISMHRCLLMWIRLRLNEPEEAWTLLVDAQQTAKLAIRVHQSCVNANNLLEIMRGYEAILFPKRLFCSPSAVFENCICSICDAPFDDCDHISGMAYDGKLCSEIRGAPTHIDHVAIVESPYDKGCVVHARVDGDIETNLLTLVETKIEEEAKKGTYLKFTILRAN